MTRKVETTLLVHMKNGSELLVEEEDIKSFLKDIEKKIFVNVLTIYVRSSDIEYMKLEYTSDKDYVADDNEINQF